MIVYEKSWRKGLETFDEKRVLGRLITAEDDLIRSAVLGKNPDKEVDEDQWQLQRYNGPFRTYFEGWPVTLSQVEVAVRTPEYIANRICNRGTKKPSTEELNKMIEELKESWGGKTEIMKYGGVISVHIGDVDERSHLTLETQNFPRNSYGTFLCIERENHPIFPGAKFDYRNEGPWPGYFWGDEVYDYVNGLIQISQKCDCGISTKDVRIGTRDGELLLGNHLHIYPHFETGISGQVEECRKMQKAYCQGKALWGDKFKINPQDRGRGELRDFLGNLENVGEYSSKGQVQS